MSDPFLSQGGGGGSMQERQLRAQLQKLSGRVKELEEQLTAAQAAPAPQATAAECSSCGDKANEVRVLTSKLERASAEMDAFKADYVEKKDRWAAETTSLRRNSARLSEQPPPTPTRPSAALSTTSSVPQEQFDRMTKLIESLVDRLDGIEQTVGERLSAGHAAAAPQPVQVTLQFNPELTNVPLFVPVGDSNVSSAPVQTYVPAAAVSSSSVSAPATSGYGRGRGRATTTFASRIASAAAPSQPQATSASTPPPPPTATRPPQPAAASRKSTGSAARVKRGTPTPSVDSTMEFKRPRVDLRPTPAANPWAESSTPIRDFLVKSGKCDKNAQGTLAQSLVKSAKSQQALATMVVEYALSEDLSSMTHNKLKQDALYLNSLGALLSVKARALDVLNPTEGDGVDTDALSPEQTASVCALLGAWCAVTMDEAWARVFIHDAVLKFLSTIRTHSDRRQAAFECLCAGAANIGKFFSQSLQNSYSTFVGVVMQAVLAGHYEGTFRGKGPGRCAWWSELCATMGWVERPNVADVSVLEDRLCSCVTKAQKPSDELDDCVTALRILFQNHSADQAIELWRSKIGSNIHRTAPAVVTEVSAVALANIVVDFGFTDTASDLDSFIRDFFVDVLNRTSYSSTAQLCVANAVLHFARPPQRPEDLRPIEAVLRWVDRRQKAADPVTRLSLMKQVHTAVAPLLALAAKK